LNFAAYPKKFLFPRMFNKNLFALKKIKKNYS